MGISLHGGGYFRHDTDPGGENFRHKMTYSQRCLSCLAANTWRVYKVVSTFRYIKILVAWFVCSITVHHAYGSVSKLGWYSSPANSPGFWDQENVQRSWNCAWQPRHGSPCGLSLPPPFNTITLSHNNKKRWFINRGELSSISLLTMPARVSPSRLARDACWGVPYTKDYIYN